MDEIAVNNAEMLWEKYYLNAEFTGAYVSNVGFKNIFNLGIS